MAKRMVAVNELNLRIGEDHCNAKLSNRDVDSIRELHEEHGASYDRLLDWFPVSKSLIAKICRYEIRAQTPMRWRAPRAPRK
ncbi:hypothetical protein CXK94_08380 [Stutzerimonas stutzeri]|uniref:Uncharacterized protein n=1 Tax=Stutzerimonas stutzeri TaxID=316 RepID=A0A2N8T660_STUST|nr:MULTISPECIES: hypothetical protein [Pseudomonadaceae]MCQ4325768.1 hypothetical protein [Stutzerimonas stutzeri]PNG10196.1 hypothetical protein CXK94_08380 [Stutzerimonas stutzeri]UIP88221.1 hypothetical protein HU825_17385 [Pseudomonas phenolilytica]